MTDPNPVYGPATGTIPAGWYPEPGTGRIRWWDGSAWSDQFQPPAPARPSNPLAVVALVLGITGWFLMGIPFFIGWFLGGPLDIAAVVLGILGIVRANSIGGSGRGMAITGLVFASVSLLSVFIGAGSVW